MQSLVLIDNPINPSKYLAEGSYGRFNHGPCFSLFFHMGETLAFMFCFLPLINEIDL